MIVLSSIWMAYRSSKLEEEDDWLQYKGCICGTNRHAPAYVRRNTDLGFSGIWVCCDICDTWMHGECVGFFTSEDAEAANFVCPRCKDSVQVGVERVGNKEQEKEKGESEPEEREKEKGEAGPEEEQGEESESESEEDDDSSSEESESDSKESEAESEESEKQKAKGGEKLTAYEKQRLENIARNQKILESLGLASGITSALSSGRSRGGRGRGSGRGRGRGSVESEKRSSTRKKKDPDYKEDSDSDYGPSEKRQRLGLRRVTHRRRYNEDDSDDESGLEPRRTQHIELPATKPKKQNDGRGKHMATKAVVHVHDSQRNPDFAGCSEIAQARHQESVTKKYMDVDEQIRAKFPILQKDDGSYTYTWKGRSSSGWYYRATVRIPGTRTVANYGIFCDEQLAALVGVVGRTTGKSKEAVWEMLGIAEV